MRCKLVTTKGYFKTKVMILQSTQNLFIEVASGFLPTYDIVGQTYDIV